MRPASKLTRIRENPLLKCSVENFLKSGSHSSKDNGSKPHHIQQHMEKCKKSFIREKKIEWYIRPINHSRGCHKIPLSYELVTFRRQYRSSKRRIHSRRTISWRTRRKREPDWRRTLDQRWWSVSTLQTP